MAKKEFSAGEVIALQEETQKGIRVIGEQHGEIMKKFDGVNNRLDKIENRLERVEDSVTSMKYLLRQKVDIEDFEILEKRVIHLEKKFA